jgi:hypothetical protein
MFLSALSSPARYQWEDNSGSFYASQSNNCGPTCVTKIAAYYNDNNSISIEATRRLVTGCCVPTTASQQALMLSRRGVPATSRWIDTLEQIDELVGWDGTRPIIIGVEMYRVPAGVRDHPFLGWHAIVILARARKTFNGVELQGYWVMDPNFSPPGGHRPDPDRGRKFYARSVLQYAYINNYARWAVVPNRRKQVFVNSVAAGDPALYQDKFVTQLGKAVTVRANKPFRSGSSIKSPVVKRFSNNHTLRLVGRIKQEDMDTASRAYGPCYFGPIYRSDGKSSLVYVMDSDIVVGSKRGI